MKFLSLIWILPLAVRSAEPSDDSSISTELGELIVTASLNEVSGFERLTSADARDDERRDLAEALDLLPGVNLQRTGARAETGITVRGFDLRQVPVFIDGIPVYVPYDGYADLGRFTVPEGSDIEVAKSISPVLAGPNALGGLVNIVTRRPQKALEGSIHAGFFAGDGIEAGVSAGGKQEKYYWQFDLSWLERQSFRLSEDYVPRPTENGGSRNNSSSRDWRASGRLAWTPAAQDEYILGFWIQRGDKDNPPYAGYDPAIKARYWRWPQWDKTTLYTQSRTALGQDTKLETNLYYDGFQNLLRAFDNAHYNSQSKPSSFNSFYDDYTAGGSVKVENTSLQDTRLAVALLYKLDHHQEMNLGSPRYQFEDATTSLGFEAEHKFATQTTVTAGIRRDWQEIREAYDTNTGAPLSGDSTAAWNPQIVARQNLGNGLDVHLGLAENSRFPTIKDRYSYRLGQAIPNPDLQPETARTIDAGIRGVTFDKRFEWETGVYYSDVDDAIQAVDKVATSPSGGALFQLRNVGEVEHYGIECAMKMKWTDSIETSLRYAASHSENRTNPGIFVIGAPGQEVFASAKLQVAEWMRVIPSFTWQDSRWCSSTGDRVGVYASLDLKAEMSLPHSTTLGFGVTNLLDRNQQLDEGFPEEGRSYFIDLRYDF